MKLIEEALNSFKHDTGRFPTTDEGIKALNDPSNAQKIKGWHGPYLTKTNEIDPWMCILQYRSPGIHGAYDLLSYGADCNPGGTGENKDIGNWDLNEKRRK